jgi:hypothetical protein
MKPQFTTLMITIALILCMTVTPVMAGYGYENKYAPVPTETPVTVGYAEFMVRAGGSAQDLLVFYKTKPAGWFDIFFHPDGNKVEGQNPSFNQVMIQPDGISFPIPMEPGIYTACIRNGNGAQHECKDFSIEAPYVTRVVFLGHAVASGGEAAPIVTPTPEPTVIPTVSPTPEPTVVPTVIPTIIPTPEPTVIPTVIPTIIPTATPTPKPDTCERVRLGSWSVVKETAFLMFFNPNEASKKVTVTVTEKYWEADCGYRLTGENTVNCCPFVLKEQSWTQTVTVNNGLAFQKIDVGKHEKHISYSVESTSGCLER